MSDLLFDGVMFEGKVTLFERNVRIFFGRKVENSSVCEFAFVFGCLPAPIVRLLGLQAVLVSF